MDERKCIIPDGVHVQGSIISDTDIEIYGEVEGNVEAKGSLYLDGIVRGKKIIVQSMHMHKGVIHANVECTEELVLEQRAVVIGDIRANVATIAGSVKGHIEAENELYIKNTAIISGAADSTNVYIDLGATCDITLYDSHSDELSFKIF